VCRDLVDSLETTRYLSREGVVNDVSNRPFFRRFERWLVGLVMAAMAYVIEMAVLRSIRRRPGKVKPSEQAPGESIADTEDAR
jgi:hypothetical protein